MLNDGNKALVWWYMQTKLKDVDNTYFRGVKLTDETMEYFKTTRMFGGREKVDPFIIEIMRRLQNRE